MKIKFLTVVCASLLLSACAQKSQNAEKNAATDSLAVEKSAGAATQAGVAINLTAEDFMQQIANVSEAGWKYKGDEPCVVDFYATWCPPCKMLSPVLDTLAAEYAAHFNLYKIDVDQAKDLAQKLEIQSIPTLYLFKKGADPVVLIGYKTHAEMTQELRKAGIIP